MQRELGRLGDGAEEYEDAEQAGHARAQGAGRHQLLQAIAHHVEVKAAGTPVERQQPQQQAKVTHPVGHEGLLAGFGGGFAIEPKADQQIGAHPHQFPEHIDLNQVGADHQAQHRGAEQAEVGIEPHIARIMGHVAIGVDHHQERHGGDNHQHQGAQVVDRVAHRDVEVSGGRPFNAAGEGFVAVELAPKQGKGHGHGPTDRGEDDDRVNLPQLVGELVKGNQTQADQRCTKQRQDRHEPRILVKRFHRTSLCYKTGRSKVVWPGDRAGAGGGECSQ